MKNSFVLSFDLSSREYRCGIVSDTAEIFGLVSMPYPTKLNEHDDNIISAASELNPDQLIQSLIISVQKSVHLSKVDVRDITGISITGQRQATAFLDNNNTTVYLGTNTDLRATAQGFSIDEQYGELVYKETGHLPSFFFTPAKLLWLRESNPELFQKVAKICSLPAWVGFQFTNTLIDEVSALGELGVLNICNSQVATKTLSIFGIDSNILPEFTTTKNTTQKISKTFGNMTGLLPSTQVQIAGPDTQVGLIGMNATLPDDTGIIAGWSMPIQQVTTKPIFHPHRKTWVGYHTNKDSWIVESNTGDAGNAYQWMVRLLSNNSNYTELEQDASASEIGSGGVQAFMGPGSINFPHPQLSIGGILIPVPISFREPKRGDVIRSVLENITYSIKQSLSLISELTQKTPTKIFLGGGMSKSKLFAQILASVVEIPVMVYTDNTSLLGAACLYQRYSFDTTNSQYSKQDNYRTMVEPINQDASEYKDLYHQWLLTLEQLQLDS